MNNYIMTEAGEVRQEPDTLTWAKWYETAKRHVGKEVVGNATVSTIFLGIDHSLNIGPPILFETMIFGGEHDQYQERYHTKAEAIAGHSRCVENLKAGKPPDDVTT